MNKGKDLGRRIVETPTGVTLRLASVDAVNAGPPRTADITMGGVAITDVPAMDHVTIDTNGSVWVAQSGMGNLLILGCVEGGIKFSSEGPTAQLADTFSADTYKTRIDFSAAPSSNDPGAIIHETSSTETNEGVLHLMPSDDNGYGDYVSIHGTNDPDQTKLHTDGTIESGEVWADTGVTNGVIKIQESPVNAGWAALWGNNGQILLGHASSSPAYVRAHTGKTLYLGGNASNDVILTGTTISLLRPTTVTGTTTLNGNATITGQEVIKRDGEALIVQRTTAGNASSYIAFDDSTGTRLGYVGYPNNHSLNIRNEDEDGQLLIASKSDTTTPLRLLSDYPVYAEKHDGTNIGYMYAMTPRLHPCTTARTATTAALIITGCDTGTFTMQRPGYVHVTATFDCQADVLGGGAFVGLIRIYEDGGYKWMPAQAIFVPQTAGDRACVGCSTVYYCAAGNTSVSLYGYKGINSGTYVFNTQHTNMTVLQFS
jgi:hypothetical protein